MGVECPGEGGGAVVLVADEEPGAGVVAAFGVGGGGDPGVAEQELNLSWAVFWAAGHRGVHVLVRPWLAWCRVLTVGASVWAGCRWWLREPSTRPGPIERRRWSRGERCGCVAGAATPGRIPGWSVWTVRR